MAGETPDKTLVERMKELDRQFGAAAARLSRTGDKRLFFTLAHGFITTQIGTHIDLFAKPNALMRLNDNFATTYLKAVNGSPHALWTQAFNYCNMLTAAEDTGIPIPFPRDLCAGRMAHVHIHKDLRDALIAEKGVDPQDYGNVLTFVLRGSLYAQVKIRGAAGAAGMTMLQVAATSFMDVDVKEWRNRVYEDAYKDDAEFRARYGGKVPDPAPAFLQALAARDAKK